MTVTFLIDECLSPELVRIAHRDGYAAVAVRDRGWIGLKDPEIVAKALEHDMVLVTRNARDFRGSSPTATGGLLRKVDVHPGLVCIDTERDDGFDIPKQLRLFEVVLEEMKTAPDLMNQALEVVEEEDGGVVVTRYELPEGG